MEKYVGDMRRAVCSHWNPNNLPVAFIIKFDVTVVDDKVHVFDEVIAAQG